MDDKDLSIGRYFVASDKDGELRIFTKGKPTRNLKDCYWSYNIDDDYGEYDNEFYSARLDTTSFPKLTWDDEPIAVTIMNEQCFSELLDREVSLQKEIDELKKQLNVNGVVNIETNNGDIL